MAYMLKYDTVHGKFDEEVSYTADSITVNGRGSRSSPRRTCPISGGKFAEYIVESTGSS